MKHIYVFYLVRRGVCFICSTFHFRYVFRDDRQPQQQAVMGCDPQGYPVGGTVGVPPKDAFGSNVSAQGQLVEHQQLQQQRGYRSGRDGAERDLNRPYSEFDTAAAGSDRTRLRDDGGSAAASGRDRQNRVSSVLDSPPSERHPGRLMRAAGPGGGSGAGGRRGDPGLASREAGGRHARKSQPINSRPAGARQRDDYPEDERIYVESQTYVDPGVVLACSSPTTRGGRPKDFWQSDSLVADQLDYRGGSSGGPASSPPKPPQHRRRNGRRRRSSVSSSEDGVLSSPEGSSYEEQELESESISEQGLYTSNSSISIRTVVAVVPTEWSVGRSVYRSIGQSLVRSFVRSFIR